MRGREDEAGSRAQRCGEPLLIAEILGRKLWIGLEGGGEKRGWKREEKLVLRSLVEVSAHRVQKQSAEWCNVRCKEA